MARLTLQSSANSGLDRSEAILERDDHALLNLCTAPPAHAPVCTSLESLIASHEPRVRRLAHRLLGWGGDAAEVDDVVQDVFLAAWRNQHRFRGEASIATWLAAVTINRCRSHHRRQFLRLRWLRSWHHTATAPDASTCTDRDETGLQVRSAVAAMQPKDREVIVLFYLEELPLAQIATLLNVSVNAVGVRLHRARLRLKEKLQDLE